MSLIYQNRNLIVVELTNYDKPYFSNYCHQLDSTDLLKIWNLISNDLKINTIMITQVEISDSILFKFLSELIKYPQITSLGFERVKFETYKSLIFYLSTCYCVPNLCLAGHEFGYRNRDILIHSILISKVTSLNLYNISDEMSNQISTIFQDSKSNLNRMYLAPRNEQLFTHWISALSSPLIDVRNLIIRTSTDQKLIPFLGFLSKNTKIKILGLSPYKYSKETTLVDQVLKLIAHHPSLQILNFYVQGYKDIPDKEYLIESIRNSQFLDSKNESLTLKMINFYIIEGDSPRQFFPSDQTDERLPLPDDVQTMITQFNQRFKI